MSLVPLLLSEALEDMLRLRRQRCMFDQNFGLGVLNDDLMQPGLMTVPLLSGYIRPWRHQTNVTSGISQIQNTKDSFQVNLDVQQFKPDEINVKMVDNCLVVEGKHEEREDEHGYISRQFQRRYRVPDDVDPDTVISKLSSDGILSIEAPKKALPSLNNERVVNIIHTNAPAINQRNPDSGSEKME